VKSSSSREVAGRRASGRPCYSREEEAARRGPIQTLEQQRSDGEEQISGRLGLRRWRFSLAERGCRSSSSSGLVVWSSSVVVGYWRARHAWPGRDGGQWCSRVGNLGEMPGLPI
jgi:hypothetical protein